MSNGDDVVDNWEEIDEAKLNTLKTLSTSSCNSTFESITTKTSYNNLTTNSSAASAIFTTTSNTSHTNTITNTSTSASRPTTQMKLLQRSNNQDSNASVKSSNAKSPLDDMSATFQPVMMVLHKPQDEYQSANYTAPIANQTVKILRRPTQSTEPRNNGIRPKQPIKTLQQREQEYAEARLRILGSAKNPEDEEQKTSTTTTTTITTSTTNSTPSTPTATVAALSNSNMTNMVSNAKLNSPKTQGNVVNTNQYNNHYNQQLQQQQQQYQQNYQQQQQQQQNYYYNQQQQSPQQQQQQQPQSPAYNNNRTYNMNPLLGLGPMGPLGPPAQYQITTQTQQVQQQQQQQQQHLKYQQYHQKSPQQQHKSQQQHQQTWSPVVGGSVSSPSLLRQQQNDTILRLPRGPDGTAGFQMRR